MEIIAYRWVKYLLFKYILFQEIPLIHSENVSQFTQQKKKKKWVKKHTDAYSMQIYTDLRMNATTKCFISIASFDLNAVIIIIALSTATLLY